ncbi:MAG: hypothetical protein GY928_36000 [Colwellia sp.]|nr:hypothetical protein [Colwellia sp.]
MEYKLKDLRAYEEEPEKRALPVKDNEIKLSFTSEAFCVLYLQFGIVPIQ